VSGVLTHREQTAAFPFCKENSQIKAAIPKSDDWNLFNGKTYD
jgi:hypothetical protein